MAVSQTVRTDAAHCAEEQTWLRYLALDNKADMFDSFMGHCLKEEEFVLM